MHETVSIAMRRFELANGKKGKFWRLEVDGRAFTVTCGNIGSKGKSKKKSCKNHKKAKEKAEKLVKKKRKKGYGEVGLQGQDKNESSQEAGLVCANEGAGAHKFAKKKRKREKGYGEVEKQVEENEGSQGASLVCANKNSGAQKDLKRRQREDGGWEEVQKLNGLKFGWAITYNSDGSKCRERHYIKGKKHGPHRSWYRNGQLKAEHYYVEDKLNGPWKVWHQNGVLKNDAYFTNGEKDLFDRWYNRLGHLIAEMSIFGGIQNGTEVSNILDKGKTKNVVLEYQNGKYLGFKVLANPQDFDE
ncbi:MAG: WGR domain-containing protein [Cyanobacteria bacterium]|nr:WGR domain-containing protein [Cyanobacteriota bacterium]